MVDLFATDRLKRILPSFKSFIEQELFPLEIALLQLPFQQAEEILDGKREKAKSMGLWAPYLSEKDGGMGLSMMEFAQVSEQMATTPFGHYVFNCQAPDIGNIELMHHHASAALQDKYLRPLMKGRNPELFFHDRTGICRVKPGQPGNYGYA